MTRHDKTHVENMLMFALRIQNRICGVDLENFLYNEEKYCGIL